jgi:hypothetical protein
MLYAPSPFLEVMEITIMAVGLAWQFAVDNWPIIDLS